MDLGMDTNEAIWKSTQIVHNRELKADERVRKNAAQWRLMGELLPFEAQDAFTFLDLGAGTGSAARAILDLYPRSTAVLTDFSAPMMAVGEAEMAPFAGRFRYLEFDMSTGDWPGAIPAAFDAVVTSMCIHHMPDHRKAGLFTEIFDHLAPGGWYLNYDSVSSADPLVTATWNRVIDLDPEAARKRLHGTAEERARRENHRQYLIPLPQQLDYLRAAGFQGIDVYWKHLDDVIYGGRRPA
ncbi:class I SAM-dependent methyltransferase [Pengzhenrongella frigida]|uniref:Class I SAM-dependent methyltransferase n=1 Tax=Pengzhenrongella frigida TaxID=1259133 RepID=A0A4Q5N2F0_9MICO|nr:class I SAM-dependent methyltransferase [Cellulomonas sp. HLT2-17]RYV52310.1 class I SAM-dependent methyltransferase [Cellulomonas sp. HLT2-17]